MQLHAALGNHKLAFAKVLKKSRIAKREESRGEEKTSRRTDTLDNVPS